MNTQQDALCDFAKLLVDGGFGIRAVGANKIAIRLEGDHARGETNRHALDLISRDEVHGLALLLGWEGRTETAEGTFLIPFALEQEASSNENHPEVTEELNTPWIEDSPSGGRHWYGLVEVKDERTWIDLKRDLPAVRSFTQTPEGAVLAFELLLGGYVVTAPSYGSTHPTGNPWSFVEKNGIACDDVRNIPTLTPTALHALSALLLPARTPEKV